MGASNFYNKNASKIFSVLMGYEDDETGETVSPDQYEYDELVDEVKKKLNENPLYREGGTDDQDRSYYGRALGRFISTKMFGDVEASVEITAFLRSAYHEGANLDWQVEFQIDGYEDDENFYGLKYANSEMNAGMLKIQQNNAYKWGQKVKEDLSEQMEEVFSEFSSPLTVFARFSNGETMYSKAE